MNRCLPIILLTLFPLISSGQIASEKKSFNPIYAIYPHLLDTATKTEYIYDDSSTLVCTIELLDTTQLYRRVTFYFENGNKSSQFSEKSNRRCDTARQWTETRMLHHLEIYSDTGYIELDFYDSGRISQMGNYAYCQDSSASTTIRDSLNFLIYESTPCSGDCYRRTGMWYTFHQNGQLEFEGQYLPDEFSVAYPTCDSSGIAVVIKKTSFDFNPCLMGITCSGYLEDGKWTCYNESGTMIREIYYKNGLLKSIIQH